MTREELDGWGAAIEQAERCARAEAEIAAERQASTHYIGESLGYRCETQGCPSNPERPQDACPNCRAVYVLEQRRETEDRVMDEIARGIICLECGSPLIVQQHRPTRCTDCGGAVQPTPWVVQGQYFSDPAAARTARQQFIAKRNRLLERIRRAEQVAHPIAHAS